MTELKKEPGCTVRITNEVITKIAGTAASEAEGALRPSVLAKSRAARKRLAKCTSVVVKNKTVTITLAIAVRMGTKIHEVAKDVQQRVKTAIETMTGLSVAEVNITVSAIVEEKKRA
jgi:uncharacterized alkaline shock family protein YloU